MNPANGQGLRSVHDGMGELQVPENALYGAQTQRAVQNFPFGHPMPVAFISALAQLKASCAQFPVDVYQTGSGTSSNMNANEVIATLAMRACGLDVHANDHVNYGQSSNDMIPSAIQVGQCGAGLHSIASLVLEAGLLDAKALDSLLDPLQLTRGGVSGAPGTGGVVPT